MKTPQVYDSEIGGKADSVDICQLVSVYEGSY